MPESGDEDRAGVDDGDQPDDNCVDDTRNVRVFGALVDDAGDQCRAEENQHNREPLLGINRQP